MARCRHATPRAEAERDPTGDEARQYGFMLLDIG